MKWRICWAFWLFSFLLPAQTLSVDKTPVLEPGKTVTGKLSGGERQEYEFTLQQGQYASLQVEQLNIDVELTCLGPDRKELFEVNSYSIGDIETAELIAPSPGSYVIQVSTADAKAPPGQYRITLADPIPATAQHKARIAAARAFNQGIASRRQGTRPSLLSAIASFNQALINWRIVRAYSEEANTLRNLGITYIDLGERQKALDFTNQALAAAKAAQDRRAEGLALSSIGEVHNFFGDKKKALEYYDQALPIIRAIADRAAEGRTLSSAGVAYAHTGEKRKALAHYDAAGQIFRTLQDREMLAEVANNTGLTYDNLGEYQLALASYEKALSVHKETGDKSSQAVTLNNVGTAYSGLAEYQKALDAYTAALDINRSLDQRWNTAINLNNIAWVHASLGELQRARTVYQRALSLFRSINDYRREATALNNIAEIYADLGDYAKAIELQNQALPLRRRAGYPDGEANSLTNLAKYYAKLGQREKARQTFEQALTIHRKTENRHMMSRTLRGLGALHRETGDHTRALEYLSESLEMSRAIHDQSGEAAALGELARLDRDRGDLEATRRRTEESLAVLEALRLTVLSPRLRASLFASAREVQELDIDVLMRLHAQKPSEGFDSAALLASERGRARSLLELLNESAAEIRRGVDVTLLDRERHLQQLISAKAEQQTRLLSGKQTDPEAAAIQKEPDTLSTELEQLQGRIRETSPQYASLTRPVPVDVAAIQQNVLDNDTTLLVYSLGSERSFLWVVTRSSVQAFELPPRAEIESAVGRLYSLLTARNQNPPDEKTEARVVRLQQADRHYRAAAAKASRILLGPAASLLTAKRLLIVGEGILQYLPFGALPEPGPRTKAVPLIVNHEIVNAPSASVVAVLRQEHSGRKPAPKAVAVLADPVFSADDPRVRQQRGTVAAIAHRPPANGTRSARQRGVQEFVRLRFSRNEADEIARLSSERATLKALDFEASRETVLSPQFGEYRILHFATHGLLNNEHPELSGIVLSLVDRTGRPRNGFLRLYDIYNLRLNSDLVVLSACQTALGQEIKGEGLIGLTRGFLYAGAPRVVASLWKVDDRATAELMAEFYRGMLIRGESPAAALRAAQVAAWKSGPEVPYYWAAFTIQGEWRKGEQ